MASAEPVADGAADAGTELDAALYEVAALKAQLAAAQDRASAAADRAVAVATAAAEAVASQGDGMQWLRDALTQAIEEERAVVSGESKQAAGGAGAAASADGGDSAPAGVSFSVATKEDMDAILDMVQELAEFEKAPDEVDTTADGYRAAGFGLDCSFVAFVGKEAGKHVSFALLFPTFSTWKGRCLYLEDLYVRPTHRRRGLGRRMLTVMAAAARISDCARLHWQVLDWNVKAVSVYRSVGATFMKGWDSYRLTRAGIASLAPAP